MSAVPLEWDAAMGRVVVALMQKQVGSFQIYREFRPMKDTLEFTVFFRVDAEGRLGRGLGARIDFECPTELLAERSQADWQAIVDEEVEWAKKWYNAKTQEEREAINDEYA